MSETDQQEKSEVRHFGKISEIEMKGMQNTCITAAVSYAEAIRIAGLSHLEVHNIYHAIEDAIYTEWQKARVWLKEQEKS